MVVRKKAHFYIVASTTCASSLFHHNNVISFWTKDLQDLLRWFWMNFRRFPSWVIRFYVTQATYWSRTLICTWWKWKWQKCNVTSRHVFTHNWSETDDLRHTLYFRKAMLWTNVETNLSWTCLVSGLLNFEHPSVLLFCFDIYDFEQKYWTTCSGGA